MKTRKWLNYSLENTCQLDTKCEFQKFQKIDFSTVKKTIEPYLIILSKN